MPTLKLTEEDQSLLVLLPPEQRDAVILSLIRGEPEEGMSEGTMAVYCGIRRRERERLTTNERVKRHNRKKREINSKINREINGKINGKSHAPSPSSPIAPLSSPPFPPDPLFPPYNPPTTPVTPPREREAPAAPHPRGEKPMRKKRGQYGWVKLSDEEYSRLLNDFGETEVKRCIAYVDECAQSNGNKNKWRDWNLVVRKCHRDGWGARKATNAPVPAVETFGRSENKGRDDMERMRRIMEGDK